MNNEQILNFRNSCAEEGFELTPAEAKKFTKAYVSLIDSIEKAVKECPSFYLDLCNRTTESKLEDVKRLNAAGQKMTLKEYNELQNTLKEICEAEGYGE